MREKCRHGGDPEEVLFGPQWIRNLVDRDYTVYKKKVITAPSDCCTYVGRSEWTMYARAIAIAAQAFILRTLSGCQQINTGHTEAAPIELLANKQYSSEYLFVVVWQTMYG